MLEQKILKTMLYRNMIHNIICTDSKENDIYSNSSIQKSPPGGARAPSIQKNQPKS